MIEGNSPRVGFKGGRGEKYPRTVSRLFVEGPCCDSFGQGRALYAGTAGNWPWNIYEAVSPPPGGRARTSPPIPMHPGLSTGLRQQLLWSPRVEGTITGVYVRVACTQIQDSIRPLWECTKIAANKRRTLSLSLSLFSFTHLAFLSSLYVLVYTHIHTYTPVESVHIYIYIHAYRRSVVVCCSKREKWFAEGGGMKREGEEGEELKLPGKERNRVGLNLLDCFQLHASSLSLFIPFFLYSPCSSLVDTLRPSPLSFPLPSSPSLRWKDVRWCRESRVNSSRSHPPSSPRVNWTFFIVNLWLRSRPVFVAREEPKWRFIGGEEGVRLALGHPLSLIGARETPHGF